MDPHDMLELTVLINTKDRPESLRLCLGALEAQGLDSRRWEILVVDDGSFDDSNEGVVAAFGRDVQCRLIRRPHGGSASARNAGIWEARGKRVLFLGDDVLASPNLLEEHLCAHDRFPQSVILGPYELDTVYRSPTFLKYAETRYFNHIRNPQDATWRFLYTGNASVERDPLIRAGGFDENFCRYGWEDLDLGIRLEHLGLRIVYWPRAQAVHHHPPMTLDSLCRVEYTQSFSAWYFFGKWAEDADVQRDRFWTRDPQGVKAGPAWRGRAGRSLIRSIERICPVPFLLEPLYERLLWSHRYAGLREGQRFYEPLLERWRRGDLTLEEQERRFQK